MLKKLLLLLTVGFWQFSLNYCWSQSIDKNAQGESIIVYPDGSWRHFDANNIEDQRLMQQHLEALENKNTDSPSMPIPTTEQAPEETERTGQYAAQLENLILEAIDKEQDAIEQYELAQQRKEQLQTRLKQVKKSEFSSKVQIKAAKEQLNNAIGAERIALKVRDQAAKEARKYESIALMAPAQQEKALKSILAQQAAPSLDEISVIPDVDIALAKADKKKKPKKKKKAKKVKNKKKKKAKKDKAVAKNKKPKKKRAKKQKDSRVVDNKKPKKRKPNVPKETPSFGKTVSNFKQLRPEDDPMQYPPTPDCVIAYEGVEEFTGKKRKDVAPTHFFSFTNKNLRKLFKDKDMIECSGHVTSIRR